MVPLEERSNIGRRNNIATLGVRLESRQTMQSDRVKA